VSRQAEYMVELAQTRHRIEELKEAEKRLLAKYADPKNNFSNEATEAVLVEIRLSQDTVKARQGELEQAMAGEEEQRKKLHDVTKILSTLKSKIKDVTFNTKRKVFELLLKEVRVGRADDGTTTLNIVYCISKDFVKDDTENVQLCSSRMSLRLLQRSLPAMHLSPRVGIPLPEAYKRTVS